MSSSIEAEKSGSIEKATTSEQEMSSSNEVATATERTASVQDSTASMDIDIEPATGAAAAEKMGSTSTTRSSKKRSRSPEVPLSSAKDPPPSSTTTTAQQQHQVAAVSAASAAAAAQLCLSQGWNGLYSLLSATTLTTTTAQSMSVSGADASGSVSGGGVSSNASNNGLPTVDQVRQAALKSVQEMPPHVHLSKTDSAPQLKITDDRRLTVKGGMRGYRMARATHGISSGNYYYEVTILDPPPISEIVASLPSNARMGKRLQNQLQQAMLEEKQGVPLDKRTSQFGGHVRLGWSMRTGDLQAPVGYDKWSYAVRDIGGSKVHCSKREDNWGGEEFGPGDVVGCAIYLGIGDGNPNNDGEGSKDSSNPNGKESNASASNHIRFFKNGNPMGHFVISKGKREGGVAFTVPDGVYYPAVSLYMGASVKVNFGPHFIHQPRKLPPGLKTSLKPVSDLYLPSKPLTVQQATTKAQKEKTFRKPDMMASFVELVRTEAQVLEDAHNGHCEKHLLDVKSEREKRNLNIADLEASDNAKGPVSTSEEKKKDGKS